MTTEEAKAEEQKNHDLILGLRGDFKVLVTELSQIAETLKVHAEGMTQMRDWMNEQKGKQSIIVAAAGFSGALFSAILVLIIEHFLK